MLKPLPPQRTSALPSTQGMRRLGGVWVVVLSFTVLALAATRPVAAAAAPLEQLSSGAGTLTIALSAQASPSASTATYVWLKGTSNVALGNETGKPVHVDARFFPAESTTSEPVTSNSKLLSISSPLTMPAGGTGVLNVVASLTSDQQPSDLDGTLLVESRDFAGKVVGTLDLAVSGTLAIPTDVVFEPSEVTLQVTRLQGFETAGDVLHVRLRGPGVDKLVATVGGLAKSGKTAQPAATVLLGSDSGEQTLVELGDLKLIQPGLAEATITTQESVACVNGGAVECGHGAPSPGSYSGTLTLTGVGGGPTLKVTVNSRFWLPLAIVAVLIGAFIGGLLPLLTANAQTRRELRGEVRAALADYKAAATSDGANAAWKIANSLGDESRWYDTHHVASPGDASVAAVWTNIHTARSADDLTQANAAVEDLSERIEAWATAAPLAAGLEKLRANPPDDRTGQPWRNTQVRKDTDALLYVVRDASSPSGDDAAKLTDRLRGQLRFHEEYVHAWARRAHLDTLPFSAKERAVDEQVWTEADLDNFNEQVKQTAESERTPDQQAALEVGLADVVDAIERLVSAKAQDVPAEEVSLPVSFEEKVYVARQLTDRSRTTSEMALVAGVSQEIVASVKQELPKTAAAATVQRTPAPSPTQTPRVERSGLVDRLRGWTDVILSVLIAALTAVAYIVPLYTNTWGSWQDFLAALAAGAAGQVVIKWAVLPALRSKHLPALDGSAADASG